VMICQNKEEYFARVLWGYIIGLYTSLQSYQFGTAVAYALSRYFNPNLANEADTIIDKKAVGAQINRHLPNFERRFLHSIVLNNNNQNKEDQYGILNEILKKNGKHTTTHHWEEEDIGKDYYNDNIHHLHAWKDSTKDCRCRTMKYNNNNNDNTGNNNDDNNYVQELQEIERYLLVDRIKPRQELLDLARDAGWNVGALYKWANAYDDGSGKSIDDLQEEEDITAYRNAHTFSTSPVWNGWREVEVVFNLVLFLLCTGFFLYGFFHYKDKSDEVSKSVTNQFLSALLTPFGTFSRWYLSRLNGSITKQNWEWLPIGTFLANMIASIVSALSVAINSKVPPSYTLTSAFLGAIKSGYAGSFSTVSTFVAETTGLQHALPRYMWCYYYCFGSLFVALILGICCYIWAVVV